MNDVEIDEAQTSAKLSLTKVVYSKSAILRTCYWLEKDLWFQISDSSDQWIVTLGVRPQTLERPKTTKISDCLPDFFNRLLDSQLRVEIQKETAPVRELILAKAFAQSGILEDLPPGTFHDPVGPRNELRESLITISTKASEQE
jgi:His-Xaa-Ser system protein HxsD